MNKVFCVISLSLLCLCGCSNTKKDDFQNENISNVTTRIEESTMTMEVDDLVGQEGMSTIINIQKVKRDEVTGEVKLGSFMGKEIVYSGEELELGVTININVPYVKSSDVTLLTMIMIDNELVPFSFENGEKEVLHEIKVHNGKDEKKILCIKPDNMDKGKIANFTFVGIPLLDIYNPQVEEIRVIEFTNKIISNVDKNENDKNKKSICSKGYFFDTSKNVYGKELYEISEYNGEITDYILQDGHGDWYYMGDYPQGKYITLLFSDNELYKGFEGCDKLLIDKKSDSPVHMKIDISSLTGGSHSLYALTIGMDEDENVMNCSKSFKTEVIK